MHLKSLARLYSLRYLHIDLPFAAVFVSEVDGDGLASRAILGAGDLDCDRAV